MGILLSFFCIPSAFSMQGESSPLIASPSASCADAYMSYRPTIERGSLACLYSVAGCLGLNSGRQCHADVEDAHLVGRILLHESDY